MPNTVSEAESNSSLEAEDRKTNNLALIVERVLINKSISGVDLSRKDILNIGGGSGFEAEILLKHGAKSVTLLEIASEQLDVARTRRQRGRLPNMEFVRGDAENLPFCDNTFDLSYVHMALHHLSDNVKGMTEACRVADEIIFVDKMNPVLTRFLSVFGLFTKEEGQPINRVSGKDVPNLLRRMHIEPNVTYFFAHPLATHNECIIRSYFALCNALNMLVNRSRLLGSLIGNVAIIHGTRHGK